MDARHGRLAGLNHALHRHFLWLLLAAYALAATAPDVGRTVGRAALVIPAVGTSMRITAPSVMLGFLLFAAGVGAFVPVVAANLIQHLLTGAAGRRLAGRSGG